MTSHPSKMTPPHPTQVVPHLKELELEFQMESIKMSTNIHNRACKEAKDNLFSKDNGRLSDSHDI